MVSNKSYPLPWTHDTGDEFRMSAIVADNGLVVAGSQICRQGKADDVLIHQQIVETMNERWTKDTKRKK